MLENMRMRSDSLTDILVSLSFLFGFKLLQLLHKPYVMYRAIVLCQTHAISVSSRIERSSKKKISTTFSYAPNLRNPSTFILPFLAMRKRMLVKSPDTIGPSRFGPHCCPSHVSPNHFRNQLKVNGRSPQSGLSLLIAPPPLAPLAGATKRTRIFAIVTPYMKPTMGYRHCPWRPASRYM